MLFVVCVAGDTNIKSSTLHEDGDTCWCPEDVEADEKFKRVMDYGSLDQDAQKKMRESFERKFKDAEKAYKKLKDKMRPSGSGGEIAYALEIATCVGYKLFAADPTRNLSVEPIGNDISPSEVTSTGQQTYDYRGAQPYYARQDAVGLSTITAQGELQRTRRTRIRRSSRQNRATQLVTMFYHRNYLCRPDSRFCPFTRYQKWCTRGTDRQQMG